MIDRLDIDALLISALYGELTPAEEARLTAHLEAHPVDRTALADLTQTRAAFRDSRILAVQLEPPQSVSALLLQEAARRAPRMIREPSGGWFQRFTRSFMAHPAMAAAMMLVLVAGVAGTVYVRKGAQFAETAPVSTATSSAAPMAPQVQEIERAAPAAPAAAPAIGKLSDDKNTAGSNGAIAAPTGGGAAPGSEAYRVHLDEADQQAKQGYAREKQNVTRGDAVDRFGGAGGANAGGANAGGASAGGANDEEAARSRAFDGERKEQAQAVRQPEPEVQAPAKPAATPPKLGKKSSGPSGPSGRSGPSGIELRGTELMPKDLDDETKFRVKRDAAPARADDDLANLRVRASGARPGGGDATASGASAPQPRPVAPTPPAARPATPEPSKIAGGAPFAGSKGKDGSAGKPAPRPSVARAPAPAQASPAAEPAPPPASITADAAVGRDSRRPADKTAPQADAKADAKTPAKAEARPDDQPAEGKALLGWAQRQHEQVIALVKSNNCRAAASTATEIYNRAPEYYAANVATDRSVKPCLAYLNSEREREDRSRASVREERGKAAKRAVTTDAPAAAAPAPPPTRK